MPDDLSSRSPGFATVRAYLDAMEARDLDAANALLADDFVMVFPGNAEFRTLQEVLDWAAPRYRWVKKRYDRYDAAPIEDGEAVYCFGTLYGEWPDGTAFEGIRFIDRFTVRDGKLIDQQVWNDLAEVKGT